MMNEVNDINHNQSQYCFHLGDLVRLRSYISQDPSITVIITLDNIIPYIAVLMKSSLQFLTHLLLLVATDGFVQSSFLNPRVIRPSPVCTHMAGFGSSGGKKNSPKKVKELKLKPKQQWDRYNSMKNETALRVGVRVQSTDSEWLEVGRVKSKGNKSPEVAVAKQRVLIAEHSRRLFPVQMPKDSKVEWAFFQEESEQWVTVDKSVLNDVPEGIEKEIGFEGRPDPATGFYCLYKEGRLTDTTKANL